MLDNETQRLKLIEQKCLRCLWRWLVKNTPLDLFYT